jgi:hypothetical protein
VKRGKHFAGCLAFTKTFGTMKKIFILLGCMILPFLVSCERQYIQQDALYSVEYDLRPGDWTAMDTYYTVALDVKEITKSVCANGSVQVFLVYEDGSQACLPMTRYLSYEYVDEATGDTMTGYYQKMIDFEYTVKTVNLFYTMSDFYYEEYPEKMRVRVVVHF